MGKGRADSVGHAATGKQAIHSPERASKTKRGTKRQRNKGKAKDGPIVISQNADVIRYLQRQSIDADAMHADVLFQIDLTSLIVAPAMATLKRLPAKLSIASHFCLSAPSCVMPVNNWQCDTGYRIGITTLH